MSLPQSLMTNMVALPLDPKAHAGDAARGLVELARLKFEVIHYDREDLKEQRISGTERGQAYRLRLVVEVVGHSVPAGQGVRLTFSRDFWRHQPEQQALRELLREAMLREIDECILVSGKRVYDPHTRETSFAVRQVTA